MDNRVTSEWTLITKLGSSRNQDLLWDEIVSDIYKVEFVCETWGRPIDDSQCVSRPYTLNSDTISIGGVSWDRNKDHSKYCVEKTKAKTLTCFGDMNRMDSQRKRGGGALCT